MLNGKTKSKEVDDCLSTLHLLLNGKDTDISPATNKSLNEFAASANTALLSILFSEKPRPQKYPVREFLKQLIALTSVERQVTSLSIILGWLEKEDSLQENQCHLIMTLIKLMVEGDTSSTQSRKKFKQMQSPSHFKLAKGQERSSTYQMLLSEKQFATLNALCQSVKQHCDVEAQFRPFSSVKEFAEMMQVLQHSSTSFKRV